VSIRLSVILSDDLNRDIDRVAGSAANKSEVFRKALQLYLAACDGQSRGLKLGLFEPDAQRLQTEITGL
jgi:metal-responsive CopG/Arc/MetJ family transcriptional regulator